MRILQICSARSIGGGERHVIDLANSLAERGHELFAAVVRDSPVAARLSKLAGENILTVPLRNAIDVQSAIAIGRFVRRNKIELINAHLAKDYPIAALAARIARVPFVITRHVLFPMNRLHRRFLRDVRFVIAPSNAVAENLKREGIFPNEKIVTIRYGIDLSKFPEPPAATGTNRRMTVGSIGNLDPVKGFDVFVNAALLVHDQLPDVKFKIVGSDRSPNGINEIELFDTIAGFGLGNSVEVAGWSDDIVTTFSELDILVSASRSESFGFVMAEAMLCGVPVVATETEGAKEIIKDESLGILVPIDSADAIARAIIDLLKDEKKRRRLGAAGRSYVREDFSIQRMVDETEALYRRILDTP